MTRRIGRTIAAGVCCCGLAAANPGKSGAESFSVGGYELWVTASQKAGRVVLDGRITGGPECKGLELLAYLEQAGGAGLKTKSVIPNAGGFGSRLIEGSTRATSTGRSWTVQRVELRCLER